jgi:ferredoxin
MKITVDASACESHGQCVFAAPELFSSDDEDHLIYEAEPGEFLRGKVLNSAAACPVRAILVTDEQR